MARSLRDQMRKGRVVIDLSRRDLLTILQRKIVVRMLKNNKLFLRQLKNWRHSLRKPPDGALVKKLMDDIQTLPNRIR